MIPRVPDRLLAVLPAGQQADGRSAFLGYAEWGSNRLGVLDASTLQPIYGGGAILAPSLCRSITFFECDSGGTVSFLLKNPDSLLRNPDFLLKNDELITKTGVDAGRPR